MVDAEPYSIYLRGFIISAVVRVCGASLLPSSELFPAVREDGQGVGL